MNDGQTAVHCDFDFYFQSPVAEVPNRSLFELNFFVGIRRVHGTPNCLPKKSLVEVQHNTHGTCVQFPHNKVWF